MNPTGIEWTDWSSNPVKARNLESGKVGWHCVHASDGCRFCYAETLNKRFGTGLEYTAPNARKVELFLDEAELQKMLRHRKPGRCFVGDMTDLFQEGVADAMLDRLFAVFALTPHVTWQVLTKRAERMREYFQRVPGRETPLSRWFEAAQELQRTRPGGPRYNAWTNHIVCLPVILPNVWLGTSVEDQRRADERIPHLLATPAAVRFLSVEPLLGPVDLARIRTPLGGESYMTRSALHSTDSLNKGKATPGRDQRVDWVIAGGESGPQARPMHPDWARSVRDQCQAARVPFFFKQAGSVLARDWGCKGGNGGSSMEWPEEFRVREFPQNAHVDS